MPDQEVSAEEVARGLSDDHAYLLARVVAYSGEGFHETRMHGDPQTALMDELERRSLVVREVRQPDEMNVFNRYSLARVTDKGREVAALLKAQSK